MGEDAGLKHVETRRTGYGVPHWKIDLLIRRFKIVDDFLGVLGRIFFPDQASSIYLLFKKK